jgi:NAD(P)-dependent dehydrogenase (short-subunit alcohol dehydrogenase family)
MTAQIETSALERAFGLQDEIALVTGGGSGLGLGIARCLVAAGAKVVIAGRREAQLADAVSAIGPRAMYVVQDINHLEAAPDLVRESELAAGGAISILINNAGIHIKKPAVDTTSQDFQSILNTHILASHALNRAVLPGMLAQNHGVILMITSMSAFMGVPLIIAYSAAKSACIGMTRALASEVSPHGIRVNAIAPGWIESPMFRQALAGDEMRSKKILSRTPSGRFGVPSDIGWAAVYLCSPAAKFVTGVVLPVDGGASTGF